MRIPLTSAVVALGLTSLSGCFLFYPKSGPPPGALSASALESARTRWADSTPESLEQGRQTFLGNCDRCHHYPDLTRYSDEKWPKIVDRMGKKADLSAEETERVVRFVLAYRAEAGQPAAR